MNTRYLTMTRPDISYVVNLVSQFMHAPRSTLLSVVQGIFRYLQGTIDHSLTLKKAKQLYMVLAYSDPNWTGCSDSSRSTKAYVVFLGPNLVSWRSEKQPTISKSSVEVEYHATTYTITETICIHYVLADLGIIFCSPI